MKFLNFTDMLHQFNFQRREARLYINDSPTAVEVFYEPSKMIVKNLNESSSYVRFTWAENKTLVESSDDGLAWESHNEQTEEKEESDQIQIYRLFDPNVIIPMSKIEKKESFMAENLELIRAEGKYSIQELALPRQVKDFFENEKDTERWLRLQITNNDLVGIVQKDFPPFKDTLTLRFGQCCLR
jgi:hypothetical protein